MIGIIGAMPTEVEGIKEKMTNVIESEYAGLFVVNGNIDDKEVALIMSGVGKVNAALACYVLIQELECDLIINTGIAGGASPLEPKNIVLASKIVYNDVDVTVFGYPFGQIPGMPRYYLPDEASLAKVKQALHRLGFDYISATLLSADKFVSSLDDIKNFSDVGPVAFEMEGAGVAQVCCKTGTPFISIRYISDCIGAKNQIEDYSSFEAEMAANSAKICLEVINSL